MWDVFISHAAEDKDSIAGPLAEELKKRGIRVWFDRFTLRVGDSLRRSIDEGLAKSAYGIVILSPSFFGKQWTEAELAGLVARQSLGKKVILPVWHNITKEVITSYSPILADLVATDTSKGVTFVVEELLQALKPNQAEVETKFSEISFRQVPAEKEECFYWTAKVSDIKWASYIEIARGESIASYEDVEIESLLGSIRQAMSPIYPDIITAGLSSATTAFKAVINSKRPEQEFRSALGYLRAIFYESEQLLSKTQRKKKLIIIAEVFDALSDDKKTIVRKELVRMALCLTCCYTSLGEEANAAVWKQAGLKYFNLVLDQTIQSYLECLRSVEFLGNLKNDYVRFYVEESNEHWSQPSVISSGTVISHAGKRHVKTEAERIVAVREEAKKNFNDRLNMPITR